MKYLFSVLLLILVHLGFSQSLPINFEGDISTSDFIDFDGGVAKSYRN
jgi:hypothetical protein